MIYQGNTTIDLEATDSIDIKTFEVGRDGSNVILKAKNLTIDTLTVSNNSSGQANITIISDNINIGTLDMGQGANVTILPFTDGGNVQLKSNILKASSSSELILSSGDYYTETLDIPGTSDASSIRAKDADQIVNLYINGNFNPGNDPGINSNGNNGNFGDLPSENFRMFINGDLNTGGGGTTFNATIYTEGDATLGNPTYIKGSLSANNSIEIGQDSKIYYSGSNSGTAYTTCPVAAEGVDVCYANPYTEDADLLPTPSVCMGFGGVNCRNIIPIVNVSDGNLTDIKVSLTSDGIMSGSFKDGCGVKDDLGNCENVSDHTIGGQITILGYSFLYTLDDMTTQDNQRDTYTESAVSINFNNKKLYATYEKDGKYYYTEINPCAGGDEPSYLTGPFDAWDTFRDDNTQPPADRNISTKIVNQAFNLSLASLNKDNDAYQNKDGNGTVDVAIYPASSTVAISNHITFNPITTDHIASSDDFNVTQAEKNATVGFKSCSTYVNNFYTFYDNDACSESNIINDCTTPTTINNPIWRICYATDNFAVRPYSFRLFGLNAYKRAGEDFNLTIKTVDEANSLLDSGTVDSVNGTANYNEPLDNLNINANFYVPTSAELTQMQTDTGESNVTSCPSSGSFTFDNNNFTNGNVNGVFRYSETGILRVNISEKIGSEFAKVDTDDTNESVRLIKSTNTISDVNDINKTNLLLFIPYQFDTNATYKTVNDQNWTYISNEVNRSTYTTYTTPLQGAYIEYTITAKNKDGNIVQNYTKTCFPDIDEVNAPRVNGLKLNTTFDLFLDSTIESSRAANVSFYTQDNNGSAIWAPNKNYNFIEGNNTTQEWVDQWQFNDGIGKSRVYFSINRKTNITTNPIVITVHDANTSTSWMGNTGATNVFNPAQLDKNATFYYGRAIAGKQRYEVPTDSPYNANIYYEIFCYGATCNKTLLPPSAKHINDIRWYQNTQHNTSIDGNVSNVFEEGGANRVISSVPNNTTNLTTVNIHYDGTLGYPYTTTMKVNASNWLIYDENNANATTNSFEAEYNKASSGWSGERETDTTTKAPNTAKTNRRTMW
jgi:hypothetical protein